MHLAVFLLFASVASGVPTFRGSYNLLTLDPSVDTSSAPACRADEVISCVAATVNWDALRNPDENTIILPTGDELFESAYIEKYGFNGHDHLGDIPLSFQYKDQDGSEAVLTYKGHSLYGDVALADGGDYLIEKYDDEYVLWIQVDQSKYRDLDPISAPAARALPHMRMDELLAQGQADRTTPTEFSITVYYSAGFKASTADVASFVDQVIAESNAGYINSFIPIRMKLHCLIESSIPDGLDADTTLNRFAGSDSSYNNLRRSADTTILLVDHYDVPDICGVNFFAAMGNGQTIGTVRKGCALGYYSFGHEVGHGLGLDHDRRVVDKPTTPYGYGYIIKKGSYRTIMAYNDAGEQRVNYYSNPWVNYKNSPTGTLKNDNAKTLGDNRFLAAAIGDESMRCN